MQPDETTESVNSKVVIGLNPATRTSGIPERESIDVGRPDQTSSGTTTSALTRRGTGPRTQQGKERSRHNSVTHGIFSRIAVLKNESKADFDALLNGLRKDRQPVGALEEIIVDKLACLFWRLRRLLIAEGAEIRAGTEFVQWDERERNSQDAWQLPQLSCNGGLLRWMANPEALRESLDLLGKLKEGIDEHGFDSEYDKSIMTKLYGDCDEGSYENWKETLFDSYSIWFDTSLCSDEEREQKGYESPQKCKEHFLEAVEEEIQRLERYGKELARISARKFKLNTLRGNVPEGSQLDRLLRYEAAISREIERTLNQLDRLRRTRLGQPLQPSLSVNVSPL